jgi:heptosyltransferase-2
MQVRPRLRKVDRRPAEVRTRGEPFERVRRLLVVRDDRLGDLVLSLPAVDALRRTYPGARMGLVVRPDLAPLARMVPALDEVLEAHTDRARLRREIARFEPDLLVCISRSAGIAWSAVRAGVRERVGTGYQFYSPLFTRTVGERRRAGGRHETEYALSFAHRAGAPGGAEVFALAVPDDATAAVADWLETRGLDGPIAVLHPGSGGSCPRWPVRHFAELAALLRAEGARVVFTTGPEDAWCAEALDASSRPVREVPRFRADIDRLPALLRSAALVVSNSTGPLHLAAALGTPTLGIYAPWPTCGVARWGPYASNGWAVAAECPEARRWSRGERRRLGEPLLAAVRPTEIARWATALLDGREPRV